MTTNISCHLVRDLLPLYVDGLVCEETAAEIEQHLQNCPDCRAHHDHMKTDIVEENALKQAENRKEINYLKKIKKNNVRKVVLGAAATLAVCVLALAVQIFIIGSPNDAYYTTYLDVSDESIRLGASFPTSASVYSHYKIKETEEGSSLVIYSCLASPWNRNGVFNLEIPREQIKGSLAVGEITLTEDGTLISALANRLYKAKNPYIGDASADGRLTGTLGIAEELGSFKNELQTSREPYGWTLRFENSAANSAVFDEKMKGFASILIALTDNLGEVTWEYTAELAEGPVTRTRTMTAADCGEYLGAPVKSFAENPQSVQKLLQLLTDQYGLSFYMVNEW